MKNVATLGALTLAIAGSSASFAESGANNVAGQNLNQVHVVSHALAADEANYTATGRLSYKWSQQQSSDNSSQRLQSSTQDSSRQMGYKWNVSEADRSGSAPSAAGYQWGVMSLADEAGYKWGNKSFSDQAGYKWGIRNFSDQAGYKWGIRNFSDQAGYKWGIRNFSDQAGYKWGKR